MGNCHSPSHRDAEGDDHKVGAGARDDERGQALQQAVLLGRAHWIWTKSNAKQRQGYFAAGIGYEAGTFIDGNLDKLLSLLVVAEAAISSGQIRELITCVQTMAEIMFQIYPFDRHKLTTRWSELLAAWINGKSLGEVVSITDASEEIEFIQQGIVFQLVWAVEAIRVQAVACERPEALMLRGSVAMVLTYGVPNVPCALLSEAGLPSRRMIIDLAEAFAGTFTDKDGMHVWLFTVIPKMAKIKFWKTQNAQQEWAEFVQSWHGKSQDAWAVSKTSVRVTWIHEFGPAIGQNVRLMHDFAANRTRVFGEDLELIGILNNSMTVVASGRVLAVIGPTIDEIEVERFEPPLSKVSN